MDSELSQRAFAFGRLLAGTVHRERFAQSTRIPEAEQIWGASVLAARLLAAAAPLMAPLSDADAEALIGPDALDQLRAKSFVRTVLDAVEILPRIEAEEVSHASASERAALTKLREEARRPERTALWIADEVLGQLVAVHSACFPAMPSFELIAIAFESRVDRGTPGFLIDVHHGGTKHWFDAVYPHAAARLWCALLGSDRTQDVATLRAFIPKARGVLLEAPRHLPREPLDRLLNAATLLIETDPNFGSLEEEVRIALIANSPAGLRPADQSISAIHLFWERLARYSRRDLFDETRSQLRLLIFLVVQYDGVNDNVTYRIVGLAELGSAKPYLVHVLARALKWNRPEAIPWLIAHANTAAFGLILVFDLPLQEATMMDDLELRATRTQARRMTLLRDASTLFVRAAAREAATADSTYNIAAAMLDVWRAAAEQCVRRELLSNEAHAAAVERAEEIFAFVIAAVTNAEPAYRVAFSTLGHTPRLLGDCAANLVTELATRFPAEEHVEHLKVGHEVLRFLLENRAAFAHLPAGTVDDLIGQAVAIVQRRYRDLFELSEEAASFRFYSRPAGLMRLPWALTTCSLQRAGTLRRWANFPELRARAIAAAALEDKGASEIRWGIAARFRIHLEVLLHAHAQTPRVLGVSRANRDATRATLAKTIEELVLCADDPVTGAVDPFDRTLLIGPSDGDELGNLVRLAAATIRALPAEAANRVMREWINKTADPVVLLDIEKELVSPAHVSLVREKLTQQGTLERAEADGWFTSLVDTVHEAAASGHEALAEHLLRRGDNVTAKHPWRERWEEAAFRSRLLIAYHRKSRADLANLPLPVSAQGERPAAVALREKLETSRDFYLALSDLETNPGAAATAFAEQWSRDPTSATLALNSFASRLRVAKSLEADPRRQAFEDALRWWDHVAKTLPDRDAIEPKGTLNALYALDGAELDDEFDRRWFELDTDLRDRTDFIELRLENLERRGLREEQVRILDGASARYGGSLPPELANRKAATPEVVPDLQRTTNDYRVVWNEIRNLSPQELASVVGATRERRLPDHLLRIHVDACTQMLKRLSTVATLRDEDKFNDLVVSYVEMQVAIFGWSVHDQSRGGRSASGGTAGGGGVGERDWVIQCETREFCVCEALRVSAVDSAKIDGHVDKLIARYNPQGAECNLLVVYYEGTNFTGFSESYNAHIKGMSRPDWVMKVWDSWHELGSLRVKAFRVLARRGEASITQDHILVDIGPPDRR